MSLAECFHKTIVRNCHIAKSSLLNVRCFFIEKCLLKLNKAACIRHMKTHPRRQLSIQTNSGMHLWYINTALA
ncbi:hypothetical protein T01_2026 [Trichinella spiralis]|uniref:Uncharacterized protein n=1 Tax=Trichinella spiralis TaxID=6334 RepID=A0A0V1B0A0_TRISP|nr:hypothetical protein T01_2026 [Trichinella spiralis]